MEDMSIPAASPHTPFKWIESAGGPFVIVPAVSAHAWRGVEGEDYEEACAVEDYLGQTAFGPESEKTPAIVVADEPLPATFLPDLRCVLQWSYAPSEQELIDGARSSFPDIDDWHQGPMLEVQGQLIMFDATIPGESLGEEEKLYLSLPPGTYQLQSADFEVGEEVAGRLHAMRVLDPTRS
ncbi:Imm21 family immunity protein [Streptomyces rimosus]|uniref:Imm21 family immunity protein n=1 Tax=Streptomyces rimosus TaxID=1927 RepID=UPI0037D72154